MVEISTDLDPLLTINLHPRHAGHSHTVNIKYGYFIIFLSGLQIIASQTFKYLYLKKWSQSGSNINIWKKFMAIPVWVIVIIWTLIYMILFPFHIEEWSENYITSFKRSGRIAYALIPLNIFLVLRPSNIIGLKIGYYLETLNLHKWISRLIVLASLVHGSGFAYKWILEGTLIEKSFRLLNFLGIGVAFFAFILGIISIRPLRQKFYQLFYIWHDLTAWLFVVLIAFHARPGVSWITGINILLLVYQIYQRVFKAVYIQNIQVIGSKNSSLQIVRIAKPSEFTATYLPGSHIRLTYSNLNYKSWLLPTHPFTVVSSNDSPNIELIMKPTTKFRLETSLIYSLTGPFPSLSPQFFDTVQNLNIICGGSGISFGIPVFKFLSQSTTIRSLNLIWCVRNRRDIKILEHFFDRIPHNLHIYVTGGTSKDETLFDEEAEELLFESASSRGETDEIELEDLSSSEDDKELKNSFGNIRYERPNFDESFSSFHNAGDVDKQWLIACGPRELINDSQAWAIRNNVQFFSELYEM
ncbi:ferric reductase [Scheffersomyces amazonensis]|uniref:ferric reductase n=1 Tax=Scheffersomyces amazonensis TaxID=1078765 RepID=UPI00315C97D1